MADGVVQVPPDSQGKKIDTSELTRDDGETVVERQRVVLGDPTNVDQLVDVDFGALYVRSHRLETVLREILEELRDLKLSLISALH